MPTMKYSKFILITLCILFVGSASATSWDGLQPYEINPTTPIIFSPKASTLVLEDPDGSFTVADVLKRQEQFKPASEMGGIDALKHYWILQKISSRMVFGLISIPTFCSLMVLTSLCVQLGWSLAIRNWVTLTPLCLVLHLRKAATACSPSKAERRWLFYLRQGPCPRFCLKPWCWGWLTTNGF